MSFFRTFISALVFSISCTLFAEPLHNPALPAPVAASAFSSESEADSKERPGFLSMMSDLIIARPLLIGATAIGSVAYIVSLPFTLAGGNATDAAKTLVLDPGKAAFVRCLGCTYDAQ